MKTRIGRRDIELKFDMNIWKKLEEEIDTLDGIENMLQGKTRIRTAQQIIAIMSGEELETIEREMKPAQFLKATDAIYIAIGEGLRMETAEEDDDTEVDVTLEEIEKKEARGG